MLSTPLKTFDHVTFGTMIDRDDGQVISDYLAVNIENWITRNHGQIEMRDGLTARGTSPSATNLGSGVLYTASGVKHMVRVVNGAGDTSKFQYSSNGTTWTDCGGSGGSKKTGVVWRMVQANNKLYAVNGQDTPVSWDGSTVATVSAIPNGTAIEWHKNFMWIIGVSATPDRLYFSNANDPETWGGSDFINVNLGDASPGVALKGSPGTIASGVGGRLYIGKMRSVWFLTGTSSSNFAVQPLTYEHGVVNAEAIMSVKNDTWCIDESGNVRGLYRTQEDNPFSANRSSEIQMTIAGLNKNALSKATCLYTPDNFAMFFVPNGVDDYNSLVLVWDTEANPSKTGNPQGGWIKFTGWNIARGVVFNDGSGPKVYLFDARSGNGQAYEWTGTSDNGVSIVANYETKIYDFGFPERKKKFKFTYQFAPSLGDITANFFASIDRYYYTLLKAFSLLGVGDSLWGTAIWGTSKWGSGGFIQQKIRYSDNGGLTHGYSVQVKLQAVSSTVKYKLRKFTIHYRVLGLR